MKKLFLFSFTAGSLFLNSCTNNSSGNNNLTPQEFSKKVTETSNPTILDVRTSEEFSSGHLPNATNIDVNNKDFEQQTMFLNKEKPLFVYCKSGKRSADAASKLRASGFKKVYEMDGGIMKWRAVNLPETLESSRIIAEGMDKQAYATLIKSDKMVLVDFYADWCGPCKKMKPYIDEIAEEMKDKVKVIRINVDENKNLVSELGIESIPSLKLYKDEVMIWEASSYVEKKDITDQIK